MTEEFCDILDLAFSRDFFSYNGKHYQIPETHISARPVQNPLPIYVAGHTEGMFRAAARHGYRVMTSGRVGGAKLLAEQYADMVAAFAAENVPVSRAHMTVNRFAHITNSREEGMRFAENARYQSRLASSLRRRKEVMQGTVLVDVPFPDEPSLETIHDELLIGDVDGRRKARRRDSREQARARVLFVQGRQHAARVRNALDGADDGRGQAESRKSARTARTSRGRLGSSNAGHVQAYFRFLRLANARRATCNEHYDQSPIDNGGRSALCSRTREPGADSRRRRRCVSSTALL